jgi:hypothetical protein
MMSNKEEERDKKIHSPIFGMTKLAGPTKRQEIDAIVRTYPVDAFGILNAMFNAKGLQILITVLAPIEMDIDSSKVKKEIPN